MALDIPVKTVVQTTLSAIPASNIDKGLISPVLEPVTDHDHDDLNSRKIRTSNLNDDAGLLLGSEYASGVASTTTIAASNTPTLVPMASATTENGAQVVVGGGILVKFAGPKLVVGCCYYASPGIALVRTLIYVNGVLKLSAYANSSGSGLIQAPIAIGILNLNAGDNVQLLGETSSGSTTSVTGANSYLSLTKV